MGMQAVLSCITYGCTVLGVVLSHSIHQSVLESHNKMIDRQGIRCNNHCPYGFVADVEGDLTCTCLDPCSNVMCIASVCVAEMPPNCQWEACRPVTRCEVKPEMTKVRKQNMILPDDRKLLPAYVQDDPEKWWSTGNSVCSEPLPESAITCKHKRKRWFFNPMTGQCQPFRGCDTQGNNFSRKRYCKSRCRKNIIRPEVIRAITPNDFTCTQSKPSKSKCENEKKLWFYNSDTGKCEKYHGCETQGNSFSRKVFCKATCKNQIGQYRREKRKDMLRSLRRKTRR